MLMLDLEDIDEKLNFLLLTPRIVELVGHGGKPRSERNSGLSVDGIRLLK